MSDHFSQDDGAPESRGARLLRQAVEIVSVSLFTVMFGAFILQIVSRYIFNAPLVWTLELCLLSFLWLTFWNCGFLLRIKDHIGFTLIYDSVSPAARRVLGLLGMVLLGGTFLASLYGTVDWVDFMAIGRTDVFQIRLDLVFAIFPVFMIAVIVRCLLHIRRLSGRNWQKWI